MSKKLPDADEMSARYYADCLEQLRIDAEMQRKLEAEQERAGEEGDSEAEEDEFDEEPLKV